jgi:hypothetical protein
MLCALPDRNRPQVRGVSPNRSKIAARAIAEKVGKTAPAHFRHRAEIKRDFKAHQDFGAPGADNNLEKAVPAQCFGATDLAAFA